MRVNHKIVFFSVSLLLASVAAAQTTTGYGGFYSGRGMGSGRTSGFTIFVEQARFRSNSSNPFGGSTATGPVESTFKNATGFGASFTGFMTSNAAFEFGASYIKPKVGYTTALGTTPTNSGSVRLIPVTGTLQWHFIPAGGLDPYLGIGAAWVNMRSNTSFNTTNGLTSVSYGSEWGPVAQGGVLIGFRSFGINVDAKYIPLRARGTGTFATTTGPFTGTRGSMRINPLLISAGITF